MELTLMGIYRKKLLILKCISYALLTSSLGFLLILSLEFFDGMNTSERTYQQILAGNIAVVVNSIGVFLKLFISVLVVILLISFSNLGKSFSRIQRGLLIGCCMAVFFNLINPLSPYFGNILLTIHEGMLIRFLFHNFLFVFLPVSIAAIMGGLLIEFWGRDTK